MLGEIKRAVSEKQMSVIVTTRDYIFKEIKDTDAHQLIVGSEGAIISLSSEDLSDEEKRKMLRNDPQLEDVPFNESWRVQAWLCGIFI